MKNKGYLMVLGTAFISGFSIFINKFGVSAIDPYAYAFLKNAIVALLLCIVIFTIKDLKLLKSLKKKQWGLLAAIGIMGGGIPFLLFFKGLSMTSPAGASFVHKTMFLWIFILAAVFLKEKITKKHIVAGLLLLVGSAMLLNISAISFDMGILLIFLATIFWAVENTISKHILSELPPRIVMWSRMFFGSIFILTFLIFSGQATLLVELNLHQFSWVAITGVILFGYVATWYTGLKYIKVSDAAVILMLGSPITTYLSLISGKAVELSQHMGSLAIISGVIIIIGAEIIFSKRNRFQVN